MQLNIAIYLNTRESRVIRLIRLDAYHQLANCNLNTEKLNFIRSLQQHYNKIQQARHSFFVQPIFAFSRFCKAMNKWNIRNHLLLLSLRVVVLPVFIPFDSFFFLARIIIFSVVYSIHRFSTFNCLLFEI